jgi:NAD/NADP transhydrogenase beta subunit
MNVLLAEADVSYDKLKEQYYYKNHNKEMVANNIATNIWNKYKNIVILIKQLFYHY